MAEAVGLAASIIALIETAKKVYDYIQDVKDADRDFSQLRIEVKSVQVILVALDELVKALDAEAKSGGNPDDKWVATIRTLNEDPKDGPIAQLRAVLKDILAVAEKTTGMRKLLWHFQKDTVKEWLLVIERHKSTLVLALQNDLSKLSSAIYKAVLENRGTLDGLNQRQMRQEDRQDREHEEQILQWLSPIDHASVHATAKTSRLVGSGQWLLALQDFHGWISGLKRTLYCPGAPGAGKTVIASTVIDHLKELHGQDASVGVAFVYYRYDRLDHQDPQDLVLSIARQLAGKLPALPAEIKKRYQDLRQKGGNEPPPGSQAMEMLRAAAQAYQKVFVVIDALDECQLRSNRTGLLDKIFSLSTAGPLELHVLATSRIDADIASYDHFESESCITCPIRAHPDDILPYIDRRMARDFQFRFRKDNKSHQALQERIRQTVVKSATEIFLFVQLEVDLLRPLITIGDIKKQLDLLDKGEILLEDRYRAVMKRVLDQNGDARDKAVKILSWISRARRPLNVEELCHGLAVQEGDECFDDEFLVDPEHLEKLCAGLIRIDRQGDAPPTVQWIHETAQAYFKNTWCDWFPDADRLISSTCITYLSFEAHQGGASKTPEEFEGRLSQYRLYRYAAKHWAWHLPPDMKSGALVTELMDKRAHVEAAGQGLLAVKPSDYQDWELAGSFGITPVHLGAYFGLYEAVAARLRRGDAPDAEAASGATPLLYASASGHFDVVKLLLDHGACPNAGSNEQRTPLSAAAEGGYTEIVKLLLEKGAKTKPRYQRTPLSYAAGNGHLGVVQALLTRSKSALGIESTSGREMTALCYAAVGGYAEIIRLLLEKGADPDSGWVRDHRRCRTPLSYAAGAGHAQAVGVLLEHGADVETYDIFDRSPLSYAAANGDTNVIDLLIDKGGANVDARAYNGESALTHAVRREDIPLVKTLLKRGASPSPFSEGLDDVDRGPPLLDAVRAGNLELVNILLDTGKVWTDPAERWEGWSALCVAAHKGFTDILQVILASPNAKLNHRTGIGRTPLTLAAASGQEEVAKILLGTPGIDAENRDREGRTPLSHAAEKGNEVIVRLLLAHEGVDPDSQDEDGQTPLYWALKSGHQAVVRVLLGETNGRVNAEAADEEGLTLLAQAARDGDASTVRFLLNLDQVEPDSKDAKGRTPFLHGAANGDVEVLKLLLGTSKVDVNGCDKKGRTAILYAAKQGNSDALEFLLKTCDPDIVDRPDAEGWTALTYAAGNGRHATACQLLATGLVNAGHEDAKARAPLSYAAELGSLEIVRAILKQPGVNINAVDKDGCTALWWAVSGYRKDDSRYWAWRLLPLTDDSASVAKDIDSDRDNTPGFPLVELLLGQPGIDVNLASTSTGKTPVMLAAESGKDRMLQALLQDRRVDPNLQAADGKTGLRRAVEEKAWDCAVLLLADSRVRLRSDDRWTPLWAAAEAGHDEVVRLCLAKPDVDADMQDEKGRTALSYAASKREKAHLWESDTDKTGVVTLLLNYPRLDPNIKDNEGKTPVWWAIKTYCYETAELLLANDRVDPWAMPDWTPLWWAASWGKEDVLRSLLARPTCLEPDRKDEKGRTPLALAAVEGYSVGTVEMLLQKEGVDADSRDNEGYSPLFRAMESVDSGHFFYRDHQFLNMKMLLAQENVSLKFRGETTWASERWGRGEPILVWAARQGDGEVFKLMLDKQEADPNDEDDDGRSPLWYAAQEGHEDMVRLLLAVDGIVVDKKDKYSGRTPFTAATLERKWAIVKLLLGSGQVDVNSATAKGDTALLLAVRDWSSEKLDTIRALLSAGADPRVEDRNGRTPLSHAAAEYFGGGIVAELLGAPTVDPNARDEHGRTPLSYAAEFGDSETIQCLLGDHRVDSSIADNEGLTPLDYAEKSGNGRRFKRAAGIQDADEGDEPEIGDDGGDGQAVNESGELFDDGGSLSGESAGQHY